MTERITKRQRKKVLQRDGYQSVHDHYSEEKGWHKHGYCRNPEVPCGHLEVHHIRPQRTFKKGERGKHDLSNLVTLAKCEHAGVCPSRRIKPEMSKRGRGKYLK